MPCKVFFFFKLMSFANSVTGVLFFDQEFLQIEAEQRRKKEEEERQVEERRSAAKKLQSQHEELQRERQAEVRRKMETKNGTADPR